ncbi:MAG: hypothetical protein QM692_20655 [Thermomicrobiales bacterium]
MAELPEQPNLPAGSWITDPLMLARVRGQAVQRRILEMEGGAVSSRQMAALLGISRRAVDKRRERGELIGLDADGRGYVYPVWQVDLPGFAEVLAVRRDLSPRAQAGFFLAPNAWLEDRSPLSALRAGEVAAVLRAASLYGEHLAREARWVKVTGEARPWTNARTCHHQRQRVSVERMTTILTLRTSSARPPSRSMSAGLW